MKYEKPELDIMILDYEVLVTVSIGGENTDVDSVDGSEPF